MHKKYNKHSNKDLLHKNSSYKRAHVKYKKEIDDSVYELIKVPQNSKCDINKKYYGDIENMQNFKSRHRHKEKYKHKKSDMNKSTDRHGKKYEKQSNHNIYKAESLLFENESPVKHKENYSKKEKRDKERLNNIEKYLEGLNKMPHKSRNRNRSSISLRSSENILEKSERHIRREKTFHGEISRRKDSSVSYLILPESKRLKVQKRKIKEDKKQKHKESKDKDSIKEKGIKHTTNEVFYCHVDNPLEAFERKHEMEKQFHKRHNEKSLNRARKLSCSKERSTSPCGDGIKTIKLVNNSKNRDHFRHSKERRSWEQVKFSPRSAKKKDNNKSSKEPKGRVNLGPYDKYFVIDKKSDTEDENKHHRKSRRGKTKEHFKTVPKNNINRNVSKEERKQKTFFPEKVTLKSKGNHPPTEDPIREKIEDDIKSYFTKIQTLIDKKLDYILHGSSREESRIHDNCKENCADITQHKKGKRSESKEEKQARQRSKSTKRHKSRKHDKTDEREIEKLKKSRKSHTSVRKEDIKMFDEQFRHQKRHKSPKQIDIEYIRSTHQLGNDVKEPRRHKRHNSPQPVYQERVNSSHLVEDVSRYSMKTKKSYSGEKIINEMNTEEKLRQNHTRQITNNDNHQNRTERERSLVRRNVISDDVTCAGVANDFRLEDTESTKLLLESHRKKSKKRLRRPLNLECKTVSIIGIPSQMRESIIFNETQTTTSLNVFHPIEDLVERKKKTKRFKLYYKYSLANNNCSRSNSGNSSDGKSIISDSYRIVSGNSEHNSEVCLDNMEDIFEMKQEPTKDSRKVVFVMKRESLANVCGDTSDNQIAIEQFSRKCRKQRVLTPVASKLNNIVEEPSNISCLEQLNKTLDSTNSDFDCKYFNMLQSSSSVCNLHLLKKSGVSDWNIPMGRCKCRIFDRNPEKITIIKNYGKKSGHEKGGTIEKKSVRQVEMNQRHEKSKKIKHRKILNFGQKYNSKSDIDISYDSLHMDRNYNIKVIKKKSKSNLSSHLIENSYYIPSEICSKKNQNRYSGKQHFIREFDEDDMKVTDFDVNSPIHKDSLQELVNANAYKKYVPGLYVTHKQDDVKSKLEDMDVEASKSHPKRKSVYREVTRIPSILNRRRIERPRNPEIHTMSNEIPEEAHVTPKYVKRNYEYIPEEGVPNSKSNHKKFIDVGIEVNTVGKKLNKQEDYNRDRNKSAVESKDPLKLITNRRNSENTEKSVGNVVTGVRRPLTRICNSQINDKDPSKRQRSISQESKRPISQQSKRQNSCLTEIIKPMKSANNPKLPANIVAERSNIRKIKRPLTATEKPQGIDVSENIPVHEIKKSISTAEKITKPNLSDIKKNPRINLNSSKLREGPVQKCVGINTSQATLPRNSRAQKQIRSNSCSYKSRLSNKCADLNTSKSNLSLCNVNTESEESKITSLVCLDKFINGRKLNLTSTSQTQSLDQYTTKSIISDPCHSSRLFLTKDYSTPINAYQRRKMYGEGIRRKMTKNCRIEDVIAPQVFEVRYLTYERETVNEASEATSNATFDSNQFYSMNKFNSVTKEHFRKKVNPKSSTFKKSRKSVIRSNENVFKFAKRNPFPSTITDVDSLNKFRKKQFSDMKIEEIFMKRDKLVDEEETHILDICKQLADIQSSSILMKDNTTSFQKFESLGHNNSNLKFDQNCGTEPDFIHLVDYLCKSIVGYCSSNFNFPQEDNAEPPRKKRATSSTKHVVDENKLNDTDEQMDITATNDDPSANLKTPPEERNASSSKDAKLNEEVVASTVAANEISSLLQENTKHPKKLVNDENNVSPKPLVSGHISCPALAGTASSFEFLYEDDSMELSKAAILANLTKPRDTILSYALHSNDTVIRKEAFTSMRHKIDQISNSPTDSGESGYSSNSSRKYSSATSFFKRPYIAALFKPPPNLEVDVQNKISEKSIADSTTYYRDTVDYNLMSRKCHEYAQKVRRQSENRGEMQETFQEIPLNILLARKSSTVIDHYNSECSFCKEYSNGKKFRENYEKTDMLTENVSKSALNNRVLLEEESFDSFGKTENKLETLIYYGNPRCKPSLEIIKFEKSQTKLAEADVPHILKQEMNDCPLVLSNTNLHKCSLTLFDAKQTEGFFKKEQLTSDGEYEKLSSKNYKTNNNKLEASRRISDINIYHINGPIENATNDEIVKVKDESIIDDDLDDTLNNGDIASDLISNYSNSTSETKKLMAKRFFENLLKVYEKEIAVTTRLFQDDEFFTNDLLTCVNDAEAISKKKRKGKLKKIIKGKIRGYIGNVFAPKNSTDNQSVCGYDIEKGISKYQQFEDNHQKKLKRLAYDARKYFSLFVQAVTANKDINDEMKICGLLKLLQRIENGDFTILRTQEEVNFENEIKDQVKEAFINIYELSVKEAKKSKRSLTLDDLQLIKAFVSKYRIGLLSKTDIIATYIGRGIFKTEKHLSAAVTYLIRIQTKEVNLKEFEEYCEVCTCAKSKK